MTKTLLCVGGPLAGERRAILHGHVFRSYQPETVAVRPPGETMSALAEMKTADYELQAFGAGDEEVRFWVPMRQAPMETMKILLDTYERVSRKDL